MTLQNTLESINSKSGIVEIFGLGYVGFPLAVRLASRGIFVNGIDIDEHRIKRLENNELKESELSLKDEFLTAKENIKLKLTKSSSKSESPKVGIICVHTPIEDHEKTSDFL